ncbi:MAG: hypothetical protein VXW22_09940 [Pseudomonadota bacterium]|nr:hypothetical protein [Pseudomonadota bacterium]
MKPMISSLGALAAIFVLTTPAASALSCSQQAAQLQAQQTEAQKLADARASLLEDVETAGDAWEDVEIHRLASAAHAATADEAKLVYETLKADLIEKETSLQSLVVSLNEQVADYNKACVKE